MEMNTTQKTNWSLVKQQGEKEEKVFPFSRSVKVKSGASRSITCKRKLFF